MWNDDVLPEDAAIGRLLDPPALEMVFLRPIAPVVGLLGGAGLILAPVSRGLSGRWT